MFSHQLLPSWFSVWMFYPLSEVLKCLTIIVLLSLSAFRTVPPLLMSDWQRICIYLRHIIWRYINICFIHLAVYSYKCYSILLNWPFYHYAFTFFDAKDSFRHNVCFVWYKCSYPCQAGEGEPSWTRLTWEHPFGGPPCDPHLLKLWCCSSRVKDRNLVLFMLLWYSTWHQDHVKKKRANVCRELTLLFPFCINLNNISNKYTSISANSYGSNKVTWVKGITWVSC